jgi:FAD/FMN-containing dehydrogenase
MSRLPCDFGRNLRTIKRALDPKNIMNPGKIFSLS